MYGKETLGQLKKGDRVETWTSEIVDIFLVLS